MGSSAGSAPSRSSIAGSVRSWPKARAFFAGEYERALETLDPARLTDIPLQEHLHLFRAAALYALYVRSAEKDEARRAAALAEMARCKELSPTFQPSMKAFAPRFISFFENGV